jgi:hypothetical protein
MLWLKLLVGYVCFMAVLMYVGYRRYLQSARREETLYGRE